MQLLFIQKKCSVVKDFYGEVESFLKPEYLEKNTELDSKLS